MYDNGSRPINRCRGQKDPSYEVSLEAILPPRRIRTRAARIYKATATTIECRNVFRSGGPRRMQPSHATLSRLAREIYWGQRVQSSPVFLPSLGVEHTSNASRAFRSRSQLFVRDDACTQKAFPRTLRAPIGASINSSKNI